MAKRKSTRGRTSARTAEKSGDWRPAFLAELAATGNVLRSCRAVGMSRSAVYERRQTDPAFAAGWKDAKDDAADVLEAEAWRRAVEGVERPVYHNGERVDVVQDYSDTLLIFLLKGNRPEKFRENARIVLAGDQASPIGVKVAGHVSLTPDDIHAAERLAAAADRHLPGDGGPQPVDPG